MKPTEIGKGIQNNESKRRNSKSRIRKQQNVNNKKSMNESVTTKTKIQNRKMTTEQKEKQYKHTSTKYRKG